MGAPHNTGRESNGGRAAFDPEGDLVDVAPVPVLARLERPDDRVTGVTVVAGGVPVGRVVAAADDAALCAASEVHPAVAGLQALLAAGHPRAAFRVLDGVQVGARGAHASDGTP